MSDWEELLRGYLILLYIFLAMFGLLFIIFLCKRCKSDTNKGGTFLLQIGREFGYRDGSSHSPMQTTLWRASSGWTSKSFKYARHSNSNNSITSGEGIPTIVVTENEGTAWSKARGTGTEKTNEQRNHRISAGAAGTNSEIQKGCRVSSGFAHAPLDVIEEEEPSSSSPHPELGLHNS